MTRSPTLWVGLLFLVFAQSGCGDAPPKPAAVSQDKPKSESALAVITLEKEHFENGGLHIKEYPAVEVQEDLPLTGWVTAQQGHEVTITAPVAGKVWPAQVGMLELTKLSKDDLSAVVRKEGNKPFPRQGQWLQAREDVLVMEPVLGPLEEIQKESLRFDVAAELKRAQESEKLAKNELDALGAVKDVLNKIELRAAEVKHKNAKAMREAAEEKNSLFLIPTRTLKSPRAGQVVLVHVSPGQYVPAAAPLITLVDLDPVWIRVPVPENDLPQVSDGQITVDAANPEKVTVKLKSDRPIAGETAPPRRLSAVPLGLVPQVDRDKHTADLLYQLSKPRDDKTVLVKDQMVTVHVPLGKKRRETVVPYDAIVYDINGNTWIYTEKKERQFERRPVQMGADINGQVIIRPTLPKGTKIVDQGAEYLFSAEFHSGPMRTVKK